MATTAEALLLAQVNFLLNPPILSAQDLASGTNTLASGTQTKITLGTVSKDNYNGWSAANNQYTVQVAGVYNVAGGVRYITGPNSGPLLTALFHNGAQINQSQGELQATGNGNDNAVPAFTVQISCVVGDTISLYGLQITGVSINTDVASTLEIRWVHL